MSERQGEPPRPPAPPAGCTQAQVRFPLAGHPVQSQTPGLLLEGTALQGQRWKEAMPPGNIYWAQVSIAAEGRAAGLKEMCAEPCLSGCRPHVLTDQSRL